MYKLPELDYLYQDLEPFIDTHSLALHYNKYERNYLNKLNDLLIKNGYDYRYDLEELIYHINEFRVDDRENILFNLGGVLNHNLFFKSIGPKGEKPSGNLRVAIENKYGSYEKYWEEFKNSALKLKGSGYTFLVIKNTGELDIINLSNQDIPQSYGFIPLFTVDMWEHAYYLNYQNDKSKYLDNFEEISSYTNANIIYNNIIRRYSSSF